MDDLPIAERHAKVEMQVHRDYCKRLVLEEPALEGARPAPTTHA